MEEMIIRKNEVLLRGAEELNKVRKLSRMLNGVEFKDITSAEIFCGVISEYLRDISFYSYTMRDEADKALPEAVEVPENETDM
jgi:hypothetical protein